MTKSNRNIILILAIAVFLSSCDFFNNFTTYFNTYYNMERLMEKAEDEFEFMSYDKREINVYVPEPEVREQKDYQLGPPPFMKDLIVTQRQRQAVKVKLDSVIIKGSKILAHKSNSDYVEGALFLMAKSYFYQEEWRPSEIKCSELVDKYPNSDFSPDAHLLFAKNALIQRNFYTGKIMLSRTVDIAWQKNRYDILSEAFRIQAELSLFENDKEEALRPYRQAVAQSENDEMAAQWQLELAALLYRIGEFERAADEFAKVRNFSPTYELQYESYLYEAQSYARLENFTKSDELLTHLEEDSKYEEWLGYTYAGRLTEQRMKGKEVDVVAMENHADTTYANNKLINTYNFERGMDFYGNNNYFKAQQYFSKSRNQRTPVFKESTYMFKALSELRYKLKTANDFLRKIESDSTNQMGDTLIYDTALLFFEAGRIHEELGNKDSVLHYYKKAYDVSPNSIEGTSRFLYSYARTIREDDAYKSDSLYEVLADNYALTEFGQDAMRKLGFTEEFIIDSVQDLFSSGMKNKNFGNYYFANKQFFKLYENYPNHELAPRALYNIGWLYENDLNNVDSALYYYDIILNEYPNSEYAEELRLPIAQLKNRRYGDEIPDSLTYKAKYTETKPKNAIKGLPTSKTNKNNLKLPESLNQNSNNNLNLDPNKSLEESQDAISKPLEILKNIDVDDLNPMNLFNTEEEPEQEPEQEPAPKTDPELAIPDSTKKK